MKALAISMGIGAAVGTVVGTAMGAVAILMMPKENLTRKLADKAACSVEDAACRVTDAISQKLDV